MAGQSRKWMVVAAVIWIQAFTGTNFDFSAYSSALKTAMGISQVQLNYLATASDLGKALGWSSGLAIAYLPVPAVMFLAALLGAAAYGAQWLLITSQITLSYFPVFVLCLLAGCSICWFNTVCFVLCIRNFPVNRSLALSLTISFNGVSAALYTLAANSFGGSSSAYLILNAALPLVASTAALIPMLRPPPAATLHPFPPDAVRRDSHAFIILNALAFITGLYLLLLNSASSSSVSTARILFAGAIAMLLLPLGIPGVVFARDWARRSFYSSYRLEDVNDFELSKALLPNGGKDNPWLDKDNKITTSWWAWCDELTGKKDRLSVLGEEHGVMKLIQRIDFWLYYIAYFCGATVGLVYSNNLGQIAQSLGRSSDTRLLVTVYSACSFFGRLLSAAPDFLLGYKKLHLARTGWMAIALVPTPLAFFLLAGADDGEMLLAGTALVGLSSGFIFAAAVTVTSELFGINSLGVNHNILITNIPLGSLLYGLLAALVYDANGKLVGSLQRDGVIICMGRKCYARTFMLWGFISLVGLAASFVLFVRTRSAYKRSEQEQEQEEEEEEEEEKKEEEGAVAANGEGFPVGC